MSEAATSMHRGYYRLSIIDLATILLDDEEGGLDEPGSPDHAKELEQLVPEIDPLVDLFYGSNEEALGRYEDFLDLPESSLQSAEVRKKNGPAAILPLPPGFERAYLRLRFPLMEGKKSRCLEISLVQTAPLPLAPLARLVMEVELLLERHLQEGKEDPASLKNP
ncbi:MAG: hypothetical protein RI601_04525 [Desulfurivibrionaceae bacterium]|nr:hypothetical protein [Desulfurivibrionaceae bacterium]